jgi:hypothetical protein
VVDWMEGWLVYRNGKIRAEVVLIEQDSSVRLKQARIRNGYRRQPTYPAPGTIGLIGLHGHAMIETWLHPSETWLQASRLTLPA